MTRLFFFFAYNLRTRLVLLPNRGKWKCALICSFNTDTTVSDMEQLPSTGAFRSFKKHTKEEKKNKGKKNNPD